MGLGRVDRNNAQAIGNSITHARQQAQDARAKLQLSIDPIDLVGPNVGGEGRALGGSLARTTG